jgi:hypothetical protein
MFFLNVVLQHARHTIPVFLNIGILWVYAATLGGSHDTTTLARRSVTWNTMWSMKRNSLPWGAPSSCISGGARGEVPAWGPWREISSHGRVGERPPAIPMCRCIDKNALLVFSNESISPMGYSFCSGPFTTLVN